MKIIFFTLLFIPLAGEAQKLVLIDRNFQEPIRVVDSVTNEQALTGITPLYQKDLMVILDAIQRLAKSVNQPKTIQPGSFDMQMGNSKCLVKMDKAGNQTNFNVVLTTTIQNFKTSIVLVNHEMNKRTLQRLNIFIDYLRNNTSALESGM